MTVLTIVFVGGIRKTFGHWARTVVGCYKWGLMGHLVRAQKTALRSVNCGSLKQDVSEGKNIRK